MLSIIEVRMLKMHQLPTSDKSIRTAFKSTLFNKYKKQKETRIIEELGLSNGAARVDIAVVNGVIHGYEFKSDIDTLIRLPEQMNVYNSVLDKVTLVVGKNHLYNAIHLIPDWWGIVIAKVVNTENMVKFFEIRKSKSNPERDSLAIAKLLWREEALKILEELNHAKGVKSKQKHFIYERLVENLNQELLSKKVRRQLITRVGWRVDE